MAGNGLRGGWQERTYVNKTDDLERYRNCSRLMDEGRYADALKQAELIQNLGNRASILVDAGFALGKSATVREGTNLFEQLLNSSDGDAFARYSLLYNAANGYCSIYSLRQRRRNATVPPNDKELRFAKRRYQESLNELSQLRGEFSSQVCVNYGNCLSQLGRFAEAIEYYHLGLKADPTNGMAAGNLGIELEYCARIIGRYTHEYLALAHEMLSCALGDTMHLKFGSQQAVQSFKEHHDNLTHILLAHKTPVLPPDPVKPVGKNKQKREYLQFCIENGLFLNAWVGEPFLSPGITDDISYGPIVTPVGDNHLVPELLRILNEIKEAFATARYLFFLSQRENSTLNDISKMTLYFDNLDYGINGLYTGLCKTAYIRAFDILDKVARIVNVYFGIGKRKDYFWSIFAEKQSHGEDHDRWFAARPAIVATNNLSLFALADICIDYFDREQVDLTTIDARRNRITHDYLSVQLFHLAGDTDEAVSLDDVVKQTSEVLQLAKHAVLYAVSAVNLAEEQKEPGGKVGYISYDHNPGHPFL